MSGAISSVSSAVTAAIPKPETVEPAGRDVKNDHDRDDAGGAAISTPAQTTNLQGQ